MTAIHPSRQAFVEDPEQEDTSMGGINLSDVPLDPDQLVTAGGKTQQASTILAQFSRKKFASQIAVPTDDNRVRARLRELGEPITIFGEGPPERRDRLRELLTQEAEADGGDVRMEEDDGEDKEQEAEVEEEYYTEGTRELLLARQDIARYSLPRAKHRIAFQKAESSITARTHAQQRRVIKHRLTGLNPFGSQIPSDRPIAGIRFAPSGELIAAGTWGGSVKLLTVPNLEEKLTLRGHDEIVSGMSWFPGATLPDSNVSSSTVNLASGGGEGSIHLWSLEQDTPLTTLSGHEGRVSKVEFHPSGKYLASASYDMTWRLWDIETTTELLVQEGHSKEVHTISMNEDGSLLASGGLDSIGRIWDLRTGRIVMYIDSHIQPIYALDWSSDGYRVLSGSADSFMKCWDVRAVRESAAIGAHTGGVTDVRWFKGADGPAAVDMLSKDDQGDWVPKKSGTFIVTGGFDKAVKVFSADDWSLSRTLETGANITGVDVTRDAKWIASSGRDRTVKLWSRDDEQGI